jgi:hypothetical protein
LVVWAVECFVPFCWLLSLLVGHWRDTPSLFGVLSFHSSALLAVIILPILGFFFFVWVVAAGMKIR